MEKKYFIEEAKCGVVNIGAGECVVHTSVKYNLDGESKWLTNSDASGIPNFYITDECIFDRLMENNHDDEFVDKISDAFIDEFNGITLKEYDDIEKELIDKKDNPAASLIKYVIELSTCEENMEAKIIQAGIGKYADEIKL